MQKLSKNVCRKVIIGGEKSNSHRVITTAAGLAIIPTTLKSIIWTKSGPTGTDRKAYTLLRDYMVERNHEGKQNSALYNRNENNDFIESNGPGRREILHHRKDAIDIVHMDRDIYTSLKNVFSLIDSINTQVVQNGLAINTQSGTPTRNGILQTRALINEKEYLFCVELGEDSTVGNAHLRRNICPEKFTRYDDEDLLHLKREIQGVDFFALSALLRIYQKIVRKKYNPHEGNPSRVPFPFNRLEMFILQTVCSHIDNLLQRKNNRKDDALGNHLQESPRSKAPFRAIYWEVLNILQTLIHNKGEYIDFINRVLYTQFQLVDKHKHHYNYAFSVALLPVINEVLLYQSTGLGSPPTEEGNSSPSALFATIGGKPLHMQKEAFTCEYIEENYRKINLPANKSDSPTDDEPSRDIDTPQNSGEDQLSAEGRQSCADIFCSPLKSVRNEFNPPTDGANISHLQQYSISLLSIIAKKIKYMEKRNHIHDLGLILEGVNTLLHVRSICGEHLCILINPRVEFLKDVISKDKDNSTGVSQEMYILLFLDYIFNFLKNFKFGSKSIHWMIKKGEYLEDYFVKILCLSSSIRQILTSGRRSSDSRGGPHHHGPNVVCTSDAPLYRDQASKVISRVNKNIGLLISEAILSAPNYGLPTRLESNHILNAYMAYLLNDVYLQNNSEMKKIILSHFVKKNELLHWVSQPCEGKIYLEYITLYNFVKIFKGNINQSERKDAERVETAERESENFVEKIFPLFRTFLENCIKMNGGENDATEMSLDHQMKQLLHGLNKLCYFYVLCKRHITNSNFVALANCNFYVAFSIINWHIEKCLNRSELFLPHFVNMCVEKISVIVGTLKCFGLPAEEDLANCLSKFITLTHVCMTEENKKNLLFYVLPYVQRAKKDVGKLETLLVGTEVSSPGDPEGKNECIPAEESPTICEDAERIGNVHCEKKASVDMNFEKKTSDDTPLPTHQNLHHMEKRIEEILAIYEEKQIFPIDSKKMYELLHELQHEHIRGSLLLRKENQILRNKLNYIFFNFDSFIKAHITQVVAEQEWVVAHHDEEEQLAESGKNLASVELHPAVDMLGKDTEEGDNSIGGVSAKNVKETVPGGDHPDGQPKLGLHFDYGHVSAKNEYFRQLQKYEREDYKKINNVLINMYLCNPYIYSKSKDVVVSSGKSPKKVIILPQDTYRNIHKLAVARESSDGLKILRRVHNSVYLFFIRVKFFFSRLN
ncbi:conserved Plasmodium protein, unknown function [Plasmodium knowlesi strain H]|uniref:Uncharacterized protein n=3 Tax=Plasmodium knowlesi TaxID=5850 RepID=A0A5K1VGH8_PLAKH|nr:conserved Plasmodium protein, unknown function [Plasmodium knowlesi strain H]OTN65797.1 Uncharacterized protein PKNOH_S100067700 [Plasmodium knowlesi]CAA9988026.1 conserved Plasmodium protein, unknown function [Plasmodium knowlesi strain H]SBO22002.1 conserved Plasmodium protein, unknown function [Plasmodium knowlesi strain H]SBO29481.1 conserved Plasmodium protein, unknown function [Plasmodium knowlesi strain H]VVS77500.1 conserved Plasmodium protein, unknown function [Plasmodium knowlesi |eukprot:XP_002259005.1 hypothetical protein, conserved in Plasmodium species [Plasmodium knowlesi strain H]